MASSPAVESAAALLLSRRDVQFLLYDWLGAEDLLDRPRFADQSREVFDDVLLLAETLAAERFAPHYRLSDVHEPRMLEDGRVEIIGEIADALRAYGESGLIAASLDADVGGMQLPATISTAAMAWVQAANVATAAYPLLTVAAANLLCAWGSEAQRATWVRPMAEGRFFGTMCLSETQAGSSLADITTRAEPQPDGTYRLHGTKMWISGGDHELAENIVHLVLAKIPGGPPGVKGISLFIVPRFLLDDDGAPAERNDVVLAGVNHKMGFRGTVNTVLGFGEGVHRPGGQAGAVGYLIGEPHRGLAYMFHMMNEARTSVGLGAAALGYTAYLKSVRYARERPQGRAAGGTPGAGPVPIIEHADVRRMLLSQKVYAEGGLALCLYCARLLDEERTAADPADREDARRLLDILTPVAKSWPSQWCLEGNSLAIQVHGGYGYAREYDVEQHYRDNRLNPIHEGTHGIQGLDLLGRKVVLEDGAALRLLITRMRATVAAARARGSEADELGVELEGQIERLLEVTAALWGPSVDPVVTLANATIYLEAFGHVVVAWIWLEQLLAAGDRADAFHAGKRHAARFFFRYELPRCGPQFDLLARLDTTTLELEQTWF